MGKLRPSILLSCLFVLAVAIPGAQAQWAPNGAPVTQAAGTQKEPVLVSDGNGGAFVLWQDARGGGAYSLYMQHLSAMGVRLWDVNDVPIRDVVSSTGMAYDAHIINNTPYTSFVAWRDTRPGTGLEGVYIQSVNSNGTALWTANGLQTGIAYVPRILADGDGGIFVAGISWWDDLVAQRYDTGGTPLWSGDYVEVMGPAHTPGIVSDGAEGIYLGCQYTALFDDLVFGEHLDAGGTAQWDDHWVSNTGNQTTYDGCLAPDDAGGAYYLWEQGTNLYAQRMDAAGTRLWYANGFPVVGFSDATADAHMIPDGRGGALILYQPNYANISLARLAPDATVTWITSVCDYLYVQENARLATDGLGGAFVTWEDSRNAATTDLDIYAQYVDKDGVAQWTDDGMPISTAILDQTHPQITATGNHSAIIAWDSHVGDVLVDIFAQYVDMDGSIGDPPFAVLRTNPGHNAIHVSRDITLQATFNDYLNEATLGNNILVHGSLSGWHPCDRSLRVRALVLDPYEDFAYGEVVTVVLTAGIHSTGAKAMTPLCWSFTTETRGATGGFLTPTHTAVGTEPIALCPADLNGDGDMDLLVANSADNTIQHLTGDGAGGWVHSASLPVGVAPHAVITADLDRDGFLDAIVANHGGNNVSVLVNDGVGDFKKHVLYGTGTGPESVCAADFNADGWLDLATANEVSNNISILLNDGTGGFSPEVLYAGHYDPYFISSGDLNDDGYVDLVTANAVSDDISIFLNDGAGAFAPRVDIPAGNMPNTVFAADLDQDGDLDLVVGLGVEDNLAVLFNNGDATFTTPVVYAAGNGPYAGRPVDVDGDQDLDLIACTRLGDDVRVRHNDGTGVFGAETVYAVGDGVFAMAAADFDGNGALDLVTANRGSDNISLLLNNFSLSGVEDQDVPAATSLLGNAPNPFNPETRIAYTLRTAGHVYLTVHDARGTRVATLVDEQQVIGKKFATWDGRGPSGRHLASGVYFARLVTGAGRETLKMVMIK